MVPLPLCPSAKLQGSRFFPLIAVILPQFLLSFANSELLNPRVINLDWTSRVFLCLAGSEVQFIGTVAGLCPLMQRRMQLSEAYGLSYSQLLLDLTLRNPPANAAVTKD